MITKISIGVLLCVHIGCCTDYTVDGKDNKGDKTREEADMTLSPFFQKSSKVVQKWPKVSKSVS